MSTDVTGSAVARGLEPSLPGELAPGDAPFPNMVWIPGGVDQVIEKMESQAEVSPTPAH
jgi:hypothetical protein